MIKNILIIGLTFFKVYVRAQNFSITYGFPEVTTTSGQTDPSNTPTVAGLQFHSFNAIGTSVNPNASARFSFTGWPAGVLNGDDNYGNYTAVLSPTVFYEMTLMVNAAYTLNLNALTFDVRRSSTGVRTYCVRSSLDNFTNNLSASTGTSTNLSVIPNDIFYWNFDSISTTNDQRGSRIDFNSTFSALSGSVALRFYAWNSEANGGSFSLDNVNFTGVLTNSTNLTRIEDPEVSKPSESTFDLYPNPCRDRILTLSTDAYFSAIEIINAEQKIVFSKQFDSLKKQDTLNLDKLSSGIYLLKVYTPMGSHTRRFVLE